MDVMTFQDAQAALEDIVDRVVRDRAQVYVTREDGAEVVIVSAEEFSLLQKKLRHRGNLVNAGQHPASIDQTNAEGDSEGS
ncbi:type II toxin-antitoxin system Phd/YefM family antitoxin [Wenxinia saemankumensis]|uniref:Antitoxin n=1 Tax=Wenxinia saemankumensis TaxID=1447782 RepID=A0A1M6I235_9RHOB|nr:type II toxin-antitoxin system Phd/YefM family antitoxin [Wenxinia saemankumensis]SHJ28527.1 prevent-host-death family protein [Wenxinia saemankumensis]